MYNMFLNHYVLKSCRRATPFLNIGRRTITRTTSIQNNNNNNIYDDLKHENNNNDNDDLDENEELKMMILKNALQYVPQFGWTVEALAAGAEEAGLPPVSHGVISRGPVELVEYFSTISTNKAIEESKKYFEETLDENSTDRSDNTLSQTDKIKFATRKRLEMIEPYTDSWPQAMALGALPQNVPSTMKNISNTIDSLWKISGDYSDSNSTSYYTKRGILSGIYVSTEMYMLTDTSKDYSDTWDFLDRQVDNVLNVSADVHHIPQIAGTVNSSVSTLFSTGMSMAMEVLNDRGGINSSDKMADSEGVEDKKQ